MGAVCLNEVGYKMPELPEVETVVRQLQDKVVGKTIKSVFIQDDKVFKQNTKKTINDTITDVIRRGKFIQIKLKSNNSLLVHLRMTGHLHFVSPQDTQKLQQQKYLSFHTGTLHFTDNSFLTYNSIRRFGTVELLTQQQLETYLQKFGPEPLEILESEFLKRIQKHTNAIIKTKLLDQHFLVGIGNIYAQEALYHAKINPQKKIGQVSQKNLKLLHSHLQRILKLAIKRNGTTVDNYSHLDGKGDFQNLLAVYQQENCPKGHTLTRIVQGGRGTNYCGVCQK